MYFSKVNNYSNDDELIFHCDYFIYLFIDSYLKRNLSRIPYVAEFFSQSKVNNKNPSNIRFQLKCGSNYGVSTYEIFRCILKVFACPLIINMWSVVMSMNSIWRNISIFQIQLFVNSNCSFWIWGNCKQKVEVYIALKWLDYKINS